MKMIMPELRPLQGGGPQREGPPHQQALCERCKKLGYNCMNDASGNASDEVESVASEDRGSSVGNSDEEHTPRGSDDEDDGTDEALGKLARLSIR